MFRNVVSSYVITYIISHSLLLLVGLSPASLSNLLCILSTFFISLVSDSLFIPFISCLSSTSLSYLPLTLSASLCPCLSLSSLSYLPSTVSAFFFSLSISCKFFSLFSKHLSASLHLVFSLLSPVPLPASRHSNHACVTSI